jgi:hypothetical protein
MLLLAVSAAALLASAVRSISRLLADLVLTRRKKSLLPAEAVFV